MRVDRFDYRLPADRIAQQPCRRRDGSRLLVLDRKDGTVVDSLFDRLASWLDPGDLLVFNDTRVIPARLVGTKPSGGRVELLLLECTAAPAEDRQSWACLLRASRPPRPGAMLAFSQGLRAEVLGRKDDVWQVELVTEGGPVDDRILQVGRMPLPPYIDRSDLDSDRGQQLAQQDRERYQTIFARHPGAVAAPTAGLHFTEEMIARLERHGVARTELTLHVGPGTFQPVRVDRVEDHLMHEERYRIGEQAADLVRRTREGGGRVVAVGTTVVRTLEHVAARYGEVRASEGVSGLFIRPGFDFRVTDAMLTNFHLPRSTLLMLVSAFAGTAHVLAAYEHAIRHDYRFYSYGDAMLVRSPR